MSSWLNQTPRLQKAVEIMNSLDSSKFPLILQRVAQAMQQMAAKEKAFTSDEEEKLQVSLGLEQKDLSLLLESITFIFEQAAYHMTKPAVMQHHLVDTLKLREDKAGAFVTAWVTSAKGIAEHLRQRSVFPQQLDDLAWTLNIQTASSFQTKQKIPNAVLQFTLKGNDYSETSKEKVKVAFSHSELYEFYKQLEKIQGQLDSFR